MQTSVVFLSLSSMFRLTAIVPLLCLAISEVQAVKNCGINRRSQCIAHHLCDIGYVGDLPVVDFHKLESGNQGCASTEVCCPPDKITDNDYFWKNQPKRSECGQSNPKGLSFNLQSANGLAQEHELPWMTALLHVNRTYLAGGSLIALNVVLTASHVTRGFNSNDFIVRAGEWDFVAKTENFPHEDVGVRMIMRHPSFNYKTGANNIALLFLKKPFEASPHIRPICLPSSNQNFDGRRCIVSGWGKDAIEQNSYMDIMKKVDLPIVDTRTCKTLLQPYHDASFRLDNSFLCAGGEKGKDACYGDGGSPLACPLPSDPTRFEQVGIVNWGLGCGMESTPAVYTDVAKFRTWIDDQIKAHSKPIDVLILDKDGMMPAKEDSQEKNKANGSFLKTTPEHKKTYEATEIVQMVITRS